MSNEMREAFADEMYCMTWNQLVPPQQAMVDRAIKAALATKPRVTEGEIVEALCKTTNLFTNDIEEAARALLQQFEIRGK